MTAQLNILMREIVNSKILYKGQRWIMRRDVFIDVPEWECQVRANYLSPDPSLTRNALAGVVTISPKGPEYWYINGKIYGFPDGPDFFEVISWENLAVRGKPDERFRRIMMKLKLMGHIQGEVII